MKILAIISIVIIIISSMVIWSIYVNNEAAEAVIDISLLTTGLTFIYKLGKGE